MWTYHNENIFIDVEDSRFDTVHYDCIPGNTGIFLDTFELMYVIKRLT